MHKYDVIIIGAGAAGLMAAATASKRGRRTLLIDSSSDIGAKIRISGGGRCNFTNLYASSSNYLSRNPHFIKSALAQYNQHDFIKLIEKHKISYHEKTLGQLFCDGSSNQIITMLVNECLGAGTKIETNIQVSSITKSDNFKINTNIGEFESASLVIATGGLSIPKMGATDFGYRIAKQFKCKIIHPEPALVPLTLNENDNLIVKNLSGIAVSSIVYYQKTSFKENILFTHQGLSGPAILQISSYIEHPKGKTININMLPEFNMEKILKTEKNSKITISNFLKNYLPKRLVDNFVDLLPEDKKLIDFKMSELEDIINRLQYYPFFLTGTYGFAKAEVTVGGVDTNELSSKTLECKRIPNLYFIGEVVDITGWLGGYNFQWAWSSGFVAGSNA